jgi:hypothetical protein
VGAKGAESGGKGRQIRRQWYILCVIPSLIAWSDTPAPNTSPPAFSRRGSGGVYLCLEKGIYHADDLICQTFICLLGKLEGICEIDGDVWFCIWKEVRLPLSRLLANHMLITCWRLVAPELLEYPASVALKPIWDERALGVWCWWRVKRVIGWPVQADSLHTSNSRVSQLSAK